MLKTLRTVTMMRSVADLLGKKTVRQAQRVPEEKRRAFYARRSIRSRIETQRQLRSAADRLERLLFKRVGRLPEHERPLLRGFLEGKRDLHAELRELYARHRDKPLSPTTLHVLADHASRSEFEIDSRNATVELLLHHANQGNPLALRKLGLLGRPVRAAKMSQASEFEAQVASALAETGHPQAHKLAPNFALGLQNIYASALRPKDLKEWGFEKLPPAAIAELERARKKPGLDPDQVKILGRAALWLRRQQGG